MHVFKLTVSLACAEVRSSNNAATIVKNTLSLVLFLPFLMLLLPLYLFGQSQPQQGYLNDVGKPNFQPMIPIEMG
jgi:hypothetical protein